MKSFFRKNLLTIVIGISLFICLGLVIFVVAVTNKFSNTVVDKVSDRAELITEKTDDDLSHILSDYESKAGYISGLVSETTEHTEFTTTIRNASEDNKLTGSVGVRYLKDGILYDSNSAVVSSENENQGLMDAVAEKEIGTYKVAYDPIFNQRAVSFYARVYGNANVDAVIIYYPESLLDADRFLAANENLKSAMYFAICNQDGTVISVIQNDLDDPLALQAEKEDNIISKLDNGLVASEAKSAVTEWFSKSISGHISTKINTEYYVFNVIHNAHGKNINLISVFNAKSLDEAGESAVTSISASLLILVVALGFMFIIFILVRKMSEHKVKKADFYNEKLDCLTIKGLVPKIKELLERFSGSKFVIVAANIKHFRYISEKYPEKIDVILKGIRDVFHTGMEIGENYGAGSDGSFILFLHMSDEKSMTARLKNFGYAVNKRFTNKDYNLHLSFGVTEISPTDKKDPMEDIGNAIRVSEKDKTSSGITVEYYTNTVKETYMAAAEVELKMESSLKNNEFEVFYQPKVDIETGRVESCEALVRWFDPEKEVYRTPNLFLPLFEENGFIVELDKYVFAKACEFIGQRLKEEQPVVPTSVNISRITALSEGFIDYYGSIKQKFHVPDNFITLEFTESIAAASYDTLNAMAASLHKNKFLCSIDDFGSGYSSVNILKNVNVDEIKMDRIFLDRGISAENDEKILKALVQLAQDLGVKVIQEGVETDEQLIYVHNTGCRYIQGYYFSKPLSTIQYIDFLDEKMAMEGRSFKLPF